MSFETSKAMRRRWCEHEQGVFNWKQVFAGNGLDVGSGDDKVPLDNFQSFDKKDGDANNLTKHFRQCTFDVLHSSQCLEHMRSPKLTLAKWIEVVKRGGWLVITVPSWELYDGMIWPSRFNPDHKSTWSLWQKDSPAPIHIYVPDFLKELPCEVVRCELVDTNYDYKVGTSRDQTLRESDGVEAWIEFVLLKR